MKLIMLDIDGVLNSARSMLAIGPSFDHDDVSKCNLDPVACGLLARLVRETGAKICVHSTWAIDRGSVYFKAMLAPYGIEPTSVVSNWMGIHDRVQRIEKNLETHECDDFVVLDDEDLTDHYGERSIVVDGANGLSYENYRRACTLLGAKPSFVLT